jgi:hypothetical protein
LSGAALRGVTERTVQRLEKAHLLHRTLRSDTLLAGPDGVLVTIRYGFGQVPE